MNKKILLFLLFMIFFLGSSKAVMGLEKLADRNFSTNFQSLSATNTASLTLSECIRMTLNQNEELKNKLELVALSGLKAREAIGGAYPKIRWLLTDFIQEKNTIETGSGVSGTLNRQERIEHRFNIRQPLFSGFREFSARKGFLSEQRRDDFSLKRSMVDLIGEVVNAFYSTLLSETTLANTQTTLQLAEERLRELKGRSKLGKTRDSEVLSAQAQVSFNKAQMASALRDASLSRNNLSFLCGENLKNRNLVDELSEGKITTISVEDAFQRAELRSDFLASQENLMSKRLRVRYEKGSYWPTLDLNGNYYTRRVGFQDGIDWDALFTLDVPMYQGGVVRARTQQAALELRRAENEFSFLSRQIKHEIFEAHQNFMTSREQTSELEQAYQSAKKAYDLHVKEYRLGLVNNLEVLQALNVMQEDKMRWDEALFREKINFIQLKLVLEEAL